MINEKEKNYISVIVYAHNNETDIQDFLITIDTHLESCFNQYEIIIVDDASNDQTINKIKQVVSSLKTKAVTIIYMGYFHGIESSMRAGGDLSIGDFVYEFDKANIDFDIQLVFDIYQESLRGFDIVSASNKNIQTSSKLFYKIFNSFGTYSYKLKSETFRIISRRGINRVKSVATTIPYRKAIYANCGLKVSTIYYTGVLNGIKDNDEISMRKTLAIDSILLFTNFGYKVSMMLSVLMMFLTAFVGIYTVYTFIVGQPVQGWTTTMLFLSFAFFGTFVILTILNKYISLLLNLVFKRQEYVIKGIEKVNNYND